MVGAGISTFAALQLMADGTVGRIAAAKQADAMARQEIAADALAGLEVKADPRAYHLWLKLPEGWRAGELLGCGGARGHRHHTSERVRGHARLRAECRSDRLGAAREP